MANIDGINELIGSKDFKAAKILIAEERYQNGKITQTEFLEQVQTVEASNWRAQIREF